MATLAMSDVRELWKDEPDDHDYPAARDYLSLLFSDSVVEALVERLSSGSSTSRKAKDVLRAGGLELVPVTDASVVKDLEKVAQGSEALAGAARPHADAESLQGR